MNNKINTFQNFINESEDKEENEEKPDKFKPESAVKAISEDLNYIYNFIEGEDKSSKNIALGKLEDAFSHIDNLTEYLNRDNENSHHDEE